VRDSKNYATDMERGTLMDIMIDLETMGTRPGCVIASIGAVAFDPFGDGVDDRNAFYADVDMVDCQRMGLTIDADTVSWWLGQSEAAREFLTRKPRLPLCIALKNLRLWMVTTAQWQAARATEWKDASCIWSHGAAFDIPIIQHAYHACTLSVPWTYWTARDTRTIYAAAGVGTRDVPISGLTPHYAAHDAMVQAAAVQLAYKKLELKRS
jgi:3' exoribonuclease, RNase T-like